LPQRLDARVLLGKRALAGGELLRQQRIVGGEALSPLPQNLGVRHGLQFLQGLIGPARRRHGVLGGLPGIERRRAGRRLAFLPGDFGAGLLEVADKLVAAVLRRGATGWVWRERAGRRPDRWRPARRPRPQRD
jgi:hypothetical protein